MTMKDLLPLLDGTSIFVIIFVILATVIQIAPIKINPWDTILGYIGDRTNRKITKKVEEIETKLDNHILESRERDLNIIRTNILSFADSCMKGKKHTKEEYDFIIQQCDEYETFVEMNEMKNGVVTFAMDEIKRLYSKCLQDHTFLESR